MLGTMNDYQKFTAMSIDDLHDAILTTRQQLKAMQKLYDVRQSFGERTKQQIENAKAREEAKAKSAIENKILSQVQGSTGVASPGQSPERTREG